MTERSLRRAFLDRAQMIALTHFETTARAYDKQFSGISPTHADSLSELLGRLPEAPAVLDAACGTGRYFDTLAERTSRLLGTDQSAAMLARAAQKHPGIETRRVSLQALRDERDLMGAFDGVICVDALEWIFRDDWPSVLEGFSQVLRSRGYAYLTVEIPGEVEQRELAAPPAKGAAPGEIRVKYWYNHFPSNNDVTGWINQTGFRIERETQCEYYRHLILRKQD